MPNCTGLSRADEMFREREKRARELKLEGKKIIGYLCYFAPPEIMEAAGLVPYRLTGKMKEPIVEADRFIEPYGCPYVRNCFEQTLKGKTAFIDGLVFAHSCDMVQRLYGIWTFYHKHEYQYMINVPHQIRPWTKKFFERELNFFKESIEKYTKTTISNERLIEVIDLYNLNRVLVKELYALRKQSPPLITSGEMLKVLMAGMSIPAVEFNVLLKEVKEEVLARKGPVHTKVRLMLWGSIIDDLPLLDLLEECGADIVIDDTCIGTRSYWNLVEKSDNPIQSLAKHYFEDFVCPRTDRTTDKDNRFKYIVHAAKEFRVDGIIAYILAFCDPHKLDYPPLRDYLEKAGLPVLLIDDDYTMSNSEAIRTRVQTFIEILQ